MFKFLRSTKTATGIGPEGLSWIQRKLLLKQDLTSAEARVICEQLGDVSNAIAEHSVVNFQNTRSYLIGNSHKWTQNNPTEKFLKREIKL